MSNIVPTAPNINFLGMCYDYLTMDPNDLSGSSKEVSIVDPNVSDYQQQAGTDWMIPPGTVVNQNPVSTGKSKAVFIKSAYEYQETSSQHVDMNVGVDGIFGFSASADFTESYTSAGSGTNFSAFQILKELTYQAHILDFTLPNSFTSSGGNGSLLESPLSGTKKATPSWMSSAFESAVAALPDTFSYNSYGHTSANMQVYMKFIQKWGTHFSAAVQFGGSAVLSNSFSENEYYNYSSQSYTVEAGANGIFDIFSAGGNVSSANSESQAYYKDTQMSSSDFKFLGGKPTAGMDLESWAATVSENPIPVRVYLISIADLLTSTYFPSDSNIASKQKALNQLLNLYYDACGISSINYSNLVPVYGYDLKGWNFFYKAGYQPASSAKLNGKSGDISGIAFWAFNTSTFTYSDGSTQDLVAINAYYDDDQDIFIYDNSAPEGATLVESNVFYVWPDSYSNDIYAQSIFAYTTSTKGRNYNPAPIPTEKDSDGTIAFYAASLKANITPISPADFFNPDSSYWNNK